MIVMKVYRDDDGCLTLEHNGTEAIFTIRSKTLSGIHTMLDVIEKLENEDEWI